MNAGKGDSQATDLEKLGYASSLMIRVPIIRVQSVLYNLDFEHIVRALEYLDNAALNIRRCGGADHVHVAYGDCSPHRTMDASLVQDLRLRFSNLSDISYRYFDANLGSARGHNRLLQEAPSDLLMILNPDVLVSPTIFGELVTGLTDPGVGLVEARQIPIEHPKDYDLFTGETSWASTACAMCATALLRELQGFDADSFFLYCDDVDLSWRVRLAGYKVVLRSHAVVFHDKRLDTEGRWVAAPAERFYSAEAALLLSYKYSRSDLTDRYLQEFRRSRDEAHLKAAQAFELRRKTGRLPQPIDQDHLVAQFIDGAYAQHRYKSR